MNHISPCNHPESYLSGSTVETMIDRAKELGLSHFSVTDHGYMSSILKAYYYGKDKKIKIIPGVEIYFKDRDCPILQKGLVNAKYFKLIVHAKDQEAYQKLVSLSSNYDKFIITGENKHKLWTWKDLEEISKYNVTICSSNVEDLAIKHFIMGYKEAGIAYFNKLNTLFKDRYYLSVVPFSYNKYWTELMEVTLNGGKKITLKATDRVETSKFDRGMARNLAYKKPNEQEYLNAIYINKIRYSVKPAHRLVISAKHINDFQDIPEGDLQLKANKIIIFLAKQNNMLDKLLINDYSYYALESDKVVQDMRLGEEDRIYHSQFIRSKEDVDLKELELDYDTLASNSHNWASMFDGFNLKYENKLVKYDENEVDLLVKAIKKTGRDELLKKPEYKKQFLEELNLLTKNGVINLLPYFLPIVEIADYYGENNKLIGTARGSAGGFLLSYLCGITQIDPIKYELSSARFLTLGRILSGKLPDIDFDTEGRELLVGEDGNSGYLDKKYGDKYAQCSTRTLLRIKSAILDANRFVNNGKLEEEVQKISKSLPTTPQGIDDHDFVFGYANGDGDHVEGLLEKSEALQEYAVKRPKEWEIVQKALSLSRQVGRHACSYFIADRPIKDVVPLMEIGGVKKVTQPTAKECEKAGLIKYDFLVVSCLKDINLCLQKIAERQGLKYKTGYLTHDNKQTFVWDLHDDEAVYKDLWEGKTETVFQFNTTSVTPFVQKIQPKNVIDLATITSLVRPGPLNFIDPKTNRSMAEEYIERRNGRSKGDLEILNELLPETYGVIVYQEQVSKIAKELGGMSDEEAEEVREAMGKKKIKKMEEIKPKFIGAAKEKVGLDTASKIWDMMETFSGYGFNKSHAVAYALTGYVCAFLKHHYPLEWWASVLTNADDKEINEQFYKYVKDIVLPPDINLSKEEIVIDYESGKLRQKLSTLAGLGVKLSQKIFENRPYSNIQNFVDKEVCGPSMARKMIYVGVLDSLFSDRSAPVLKKLQEYEDAVELREYNDKLARAREESEAKANKVLEKQPKKGKIPDEYLYMSKIDSFLLKKQIYKGYQEDFNEVLLNYGKKVVTIRGEKINRFVNGDFREFPMLNSDMLKRLDEATLPEGEYVSFGVAGYVIECKEFTYAGGEKKALKVIVDHSGYISEKVKWADYNTGKLEYPKDLKKGSFAMFSYKKSKEKPCVIQEIIVEK